MNLRFLWLDFYWADKLFGFGIGSIVLEAWARSLLSIYWNDGELLIDVLWFRVLTAYPFNQED